MGNANTELTTSYKYVDRQGNTIQSETPLVNVNTHIKKTNENIVKEANRQRKEPYINVVTEFQQNILKKYDISDSEAGKVLMLCTFTRYINHPSEKLYLKHKGQYVKNKQLSEVLLLNTNQTRYFKHSMVKKGILHEDKFGIYVDSTVMIKGKKTDETNTYRVFTKPVRDLYYATVIENKPKTSQNVGLFFSMIPFIQKRDNHLVLSEYNAELDTYEHLSHQQLAEKLGMKKANLVKRIGSLNTAFRQTTGKYLIYELQPTGIEENSGNKKEFRLVINPNVTFSSHDGNKQTIGEELFGDSNPPMLDDIPEIELLNKVIIATNDGKVYYMKTNERYQVATIRKRVNDSEFIVFENAKIKTDSIISIQVSTPNSLKNIELDIGLLPFKNIKKDDVSYKELLFI